MIVFDTNVVSEMMRSTPSEVVVAWIRSRPLSEQHTTTITIAEVGYGIARLPSGRRRTEMSNTADEVFGAFGDRVLPVDLVAGELYGDVRTERESIGRPVSDLDALVACVCRAHGATLATRNTDDFTGLGLDLVNPWDAPAG